MCNGILGLLILNRLVMFDNLSFINSVCFQLSIPGSPVVLNLPLLGRLALDWPVKGFPFLRFHSIYASFITGRGLICASSEKVVFSLSAPTFHYEREGGFGSSLPVTVRASLVILESMILC